MQDSPELEVVDTHRAAHMLVVVDIQLKEELVDQSVTSVEQEEPPLLVEAQTCRLACPFQSCAESACMRRPCSRQSRPNNLAAEKLLEFHHFPQSLQLLKICMLLVEGQT